MNISCEQARRLLVVFKQRKQIFDYDYEKAVDKGSISPVKESWYKLRELITLHRDAFYEYVPEVVVIKHINKALDNLEQSMQTGNTLNKFKWYGLLESTTGLNIDGAWNIRNRVLDVEDKDEGLAEYNLLASLAGIDSERAWAIRKKALAKGPDNYSSVLASLIGLDNARAWEIRRKIFQKQGINDENITALIGLDDEESWQIRSDLLSQMDSSDEKQTKRIINGLAVSFFGLDDEESWKLREQFFDLDGNPNILASVFISLTGIDSPRAWDMRELAMSRLDEFGDNKEDVLEGIFTSLADIDSPRAWDMREEVIKMMDSKKSIAMALAGLNSPEAWEMRNRLLNNGGFDEISYAESIRGSFINVVLEKTKRKRVAKMLERNGI